MVCPSPPFSVVPPPTDTHTYTEWLTPVLIRLNAGMPPSGREWANRLVITWECYMVCGIDAS